MLLRVEDIHLSFGGVRALAGVSLELKTSEILAIIGPNGAGKTCLLNCINGFYQPGRGRIFIGQTETTRLPSHKIAQLGVGRTFQMTELFVGLTTVENIMAGRHNIIKDNIFTAGLYFGRTHKEEMRSRKAAEEIVDFLEIEAIRNKIGGLLPFGLRKRVELGRALAMEPKILLLDEPISGMNLEEKEDMARFILDVHDLGRIGIIIIEHDMELVMDIADRIIVLDFGKKIAEGSPQEIKSNPNVIEVYLGTE